MPAGPFGLLVAKGPAWSRKPWILKTPPPWYKNREALSPAQLKACIALGEAAMGAFGTRGKRQYKGVSMPAVAVEVAARVPKGVGAHGGVSPEQRRQQRHSAATASLEGLRSILQRKGAAAALPGIP